MPTSKRKRYTTEFKQEAVRLLNSDPRPGRDIARELGVQQAMLYKWQRKLQGGPEVVRSLDEALSPGEREELRRLRKEVEQLRMEREILKKATVYSTGPRNGGEDSHAAERTPREFLRR